MSKQRTRCSREIKFLANESSQMRRALQILQWSVAGVIILTSLLCLWTIRMKRLQNNDGRMASTIRRHVETIILQSSPTETPVVYPRGESATTSVRVSDAVPSPSRPTARCRRHVNVTPTMPRASTEAINCCLLPRLFPGNSLVWSSVTTRNRLKEGATSCLDRVLHAPAVVGSLPTTSPCKDLSRQSIAQLRQCGTACSDELWTWYSFSLFFDSTVEANSTVSE